jgi:16S rRNA (adenine1518-N6/adenine1519-N6)-dimethyltransferase
VSAPYDALPPLREVVSTYGLAAKKSLGQNFLYDLNLTGRIARAAGPLENVCIVEIGPGPGGLTRALLREGAARVIAVERDERCLPALADIQRAYPERLIIIHGDALALDLAQVVAAHWQGAARICANLPYNIGTALLVKWLASEVWPPWFDRLTLMFQREVAERIVATPRARADYGRLAVLSGWRTQARILFDVPASAFTPPPKITSSVVELIPRADPLPCDGRILALITQAAFGQRRKMIRQSLKSLSLHGRAVDVAHLLEKAAIAPTCRAEELDIADFVRLAQICAAL